MSPVKGQRRAPQAADWTTGQTQPTSPDVWPVGIALAGGLLVVIATTKLVTGMLAVGQLTAVDYGEPVIYGQALRLLHGEALYQPLDRPPYTVTAYTPLYYAIAAALQALFGGGFASGRLLSLASAVIAAVLVARLAAALARSHWAGLFAAGAFLGLGFSGGVPWFALYRVDTLGVALALGAIGLLAEAMTFPHVALAGALAGLALLDKQTFVAGLLAGCIWLWGQPHGRRAAGVYGGVALLVAAVPCLVLQLIDADFLTNTLLANVNPVALDQLGYTVPLLLSTLGLPILMAGGHAVQARRCGQAPRLKLLVIYWLLSALPLVGLLKFGAVYNYWIEFAASTAILATVGIWCPGRGRLRSLYQVGTGLLAVNLAWLAAAALLTGPWTRQGVAEGAYAADETDFRQLVERVRTEPGAVLADPMDVVVLAGRQVLLEPVIFGILGRGGMWDAAPLVRRICAGEVHLLVVQPSLEGLASYAPFGVAWWPEPVMRALQRRMVLEGQMARRFVYMPSPAPAPGCGMA